MAPCCWVRSRPVPPTSLWAHELPNLGDEPPRGLRRRRGHRSRSRTSGRISAGRKRVDHSAPGGSAFCSSPLNLRNRATSQSGSPLAEEPALTRARLGLVRGVAQVLRNGLGCSGWTPRSPCETLAMMATRRANRARHDFRFGTRELVVLGGLVCLIAGLVFVAGVVVGRETTRGRGPAHVEAGRDPRRDDVERLRPGEASVKTAATHAEEKVTFYRTLTAPTQDVPQLGKPTIEERLVPTDEPAPAAAVEGVPEQSRIAPAAPPAVVGRHKARFQPFPRGLADTPRLAPKGRAPCQGPGGGGTWCGAGCGGRDGPDAGCRTLVGRTFDQYPVWDGGR
jgi:hypothetical protein